VKKTIELTKGRFRTVWSNGERGSINVNVYIDDSNEPLIEWAYPKVAGSSILGNASIWLDQAILQAQIP
jgi:hypothetical protein